MQYGVTQVDGVPAPWMEHGDGRPVVFVHGIPTSPKLWRHVLPLVEGRCLAWELGYGESIPDGHGHDLGLSAQADRLLAWLHAIGVEPPLLVGHDLGGGVAQIAAVRDPSRFSGLVLTNAVCCDSWPIPSVKVMQRLVPLLQYQPEALVYTALVQLLRRGHDDQRRARESIGLHWAAYVGHGAAKAMMRKMSALHPRGTMEIADRLPALNLPAAVVWGADDQFQKVEYGERLAGDLGTGLQPIPGGKHFTPEDHPQVIAAAIRELR
jgi:pimeloyl-ACP methyl ester carboxylesterase